MMNKFKINTVLLMEFIFIISLSLLIYFYPFQTRDLFIYIMEKIVLVFLSMDIKSIVLLLVLLCGIAIGVIKLLKPIIQKVKIKNYLRDVKEDKINKKGISRFLTYREKRKKFIEVPYNKNHFLGLLIGRYKKYTINMWLFKIRIKFPFYEATPTTVKSNINKMLDDEILSYEEQERVLKEIQKRKEFSIKKLLEKIVSLFCNGYEDTMLITDEPIHALIFGGSRSGKTQTVGIPTIDQVSKIKNPKLKPTLVIADPKGELFSNKAKELEAEGYEVLAQNMKDFNASDFYNYLEVIKLKFIEEIKIFEKENNIKIKDLVLKDIVNIIINNESEELKDDLFQGYNHEFLEVNINNWEKLSFNDFKNYTGIEKRQINKIICEFLDLVDLSDTEKLINTTSTTLIPDNEKDTTWTSSARQLFQAHIKLCLDYSFANNSLNETFNVFSVINLRNDLSRKVDISDDTSPTLIQQLIELKEVGGYVRMKHPSNFSGKTYTSIMMTFDNSLELFSTFGVAKTTSRNDFPFEEIAKGVKPYAIFLITPDYDTTFNVLVSTFISQFYIKMVELADNKYKQKLPRKIFFLLDEFTNMPPIADFNAKYTVCLSRGIQFILMVQNIQQIKDKYGEETLETILENSHLKMYLLSGSAKTRKWFSDEVGYTKIKKHSYSSHSHDPKKSNVNVMWEKVPLINENELNLNPMGRVVATYTKSNPFISELRPAFQYQKKENYIDIKDYFKNKDKKNKIKTKDEIKLNI